MAYHFKVMISSHITTPDDRRFVRHRIVTTFPGALHAENNRLSLFSAPAAASQVRAWHIVGQGPAEFSTTHVVLTGVAKIEDP